MNLRASSLGFILLVFAGCASLPKSDPIDIYQKTHSYKNYAFNEVWPAALNAVDDIGFVVRSVRREIGLIQAVAKMNSGSRYAPPRMNVVIRGENSRIDVNFHIELPGQRDDSGKRKTYAKRFFRALRKNLHSYRRESMGSAVAAFADW